MAALLTGAVIRDFVAACSECLALKRRARGLVQWLDLQGMESCHGQEEARLLLSSLASRLEVALPLDGASGAGRQLLDCCSCEGFIAVSVCLPCGHSLCRSCLERLSRAAHAAVPACPRCGERWPRDPPGIEGGRKATLCLHNAFQRWYPDRVESCRLRDEGTDFAGEGDFPRAVQRYSEALASGGPLAGTATAAAATAAAWRCGLSMT